jgi:DNA-binding SARP family transcriptional activator
MGGVIRVAVLGRFEVAVDGDPVPDDAWRRRQAAALVKVLALSPGGARHREQVIDALWPDLAPAEAAPRLHKAAHFARRAIGEGSLVMAGDVVSLAGGSPLEVDVDRFVAEAESALASGDPAAGKRALAHWTGPLLPADLYEPWSEAPRDRVEHLHRRLLRLAGRWDELVAADPTDEEAHVALMRSMAAGGDRRGALRQFERLDRILGRELGVGPGPAALALRDELVAADLVPVAPPAAAPAPPAAAVVPALLAQLDAAGTGQGRGVFLGGTAGAGAAALDLLAAHAAAAGWRVGRGEAAVIEGAWPYAPVLEAIADLCRAHPALLDGLDDALRAELEGAMAGGASVWQGDAAHRRLFVAAAELLRIAAGGAGAVLLVADADEADEASLRLLHHLVRASAQQRVLVVLAHGADEAGPAFESVRARLVDRGAAVELVLDEAEGTDAAVDRAAAVVAGLPGALRDHLQRVALTGSGFDTDLFVALSDLTERGAFDQLDVALADGAVVVDQAGYRLPRRVRSALLAAVPPHRERGLHQLVAERLVAIDASPARIAHHLLAAGEVGAAVPHVLRAARAEATVGAYRDAIGLLEPIRGVAAGTDGLEAAVLRAELLAASGDAAAVQAYREALDLAPPERRTTLLAGLGRAALMAGDVDTARATLDLAGPSSEADDVALLLARANLGFVTGDIALASAAADRARTLLVDGNASWQLLDLVTLQGLLAHQRGEWFERLRLELRRTAEEPDLARAVFDSHLCVAEYLLYGPTPYDEVIDLAVALQRTAARNGAARAEAFGAALAGEAALLAGRLDDAEAFLLEAVDLHHDVGAAAGEAHSLQRLAEVHLARGDKAGATPLLLRAMRLARWSTLAQHLVQRIYGAMILAAPDATAARALVDRAEAETGKEDRCSFCQVMLSVPATIACAQDGDLEAARHHAAAAERSATMWEGTAWQAAVDEAKGHLAVAEGDPGAASRRFDEAARTFEGAGQPLDAERCRTMAASLG